MTDIVLEFNDTVKEYDVSILSGDLKTGNDLEAAVIVSLFTWARANADEVDDGSPRYGWWGDRIDEDSTDSTGSKLYLLKREKITEETLAKAKEYIEQALKWMITDNVASDISVTVERDLNDRNRVNASIIITRGDKSKTMKFNDLWSFL